MGDLGTHARIYRNLRKTLDGSFFNEEPSDNLPFYFEVGNFFTDVSQFHDPPALDAQKINILTDKKKMGGAIFRQPVGNFLNLIGIIPFLDTLFGEQDKGYPGYFIEFINFLLLGLKFRSFHHQGVTYKELKPLQDRYWTKYWHQEHLDAPPCSSQIYPFLGGKSRNKMFSYLEEGIQSQVELFTQLEIDIFKNEYWTEKPKEKRKNRQEMLVRMGRYSHAVEDFFFHSNYVEWMKWKEIKRKFTLAEPTFGKASTSMIMNSEVFRDWFQKAEISSLIREGEDPSGFPLLSDHVWSIKDKRIFIRRILPLASQCHTILDGDHDHLYTGGFGDYDIKHTFHDALAGIEELFASFREVYLLVGKVTGIDALKVLEPLDHIFIEERRKTLLNGDQENKDRTDELVELHLENIEKGYYMGFLKKAEEIVGQLRKSPAMRRKFNISDEQFEKIDFPPLSFILFRRAFLLDATLFDSYPTINIGVYGALLALAVTVQATEFNSDFSQLQLGIRQEIFGSTRKQRIVDLRKSDEDLAYERIGDNGSTIENPFTHSLMNKDSERKYLLREEALTLAFFTSEFLVKALTDNVSNNLQNYAEGDTLRIINWEKTIGQFLSHPDFAAAKWSEQVLNYPQIRPEMTGVQLFYKDVDMLKDSSMAITKKMRKDYHNSWKLEHKKWKTLRHQAFPIYPPPRP